MDDACVYSAEAGVGGVLVCGVAVVTFVCRRVGLERYVWGLSERCFAAGGGGGRGGRGGGPGAWVAGGGVVFVEAYVYLLWVVEVGGGVGEAVV